MAEAVLVEPDLEFKRQILGLGAHDLTACYQCGTCSVVCPISTPGRPFPRKEMVWVQWGLRDRLMGDSAIWECHQCGTCTTYCPRDAKPADVMAALREYSITHFAVPRFMGRGLNEAKYLPLLFAIPSVIFAAILAWLGHLTALPQGQVVFSKFIPIVYIEVVFILAMTLSLLGAAAGGIRYWRAMSFQMAEVGNGQRPARRLIPTLLTILRHRKFRKCVEEPAGTRKTYKEHLHRTHLLAFYGFLGLVVTTTSVGIGIYAFGYLTPWPLWHPVKILGNVSGLALIAALGVFGYRRIADKEKAGKSTYSDWLFLDILLLTTLTGFLCQLLRLSGVPSLAYPTYFIHLVFVFFLLVYIPYSKFAHLVYRTVAMLHAKEESWTALRVAGGFLPPLVAVLLVGSVIVGCARGPAFRGTPLDPPRELLEFTLRDQFGHAVHLADLNGRVVVLTFLYTFCPDVCPLVTANLRRTSDLLEGAGAVAFLAVTVDPERDTEARAREYSKRYGMLDRWHFLVGSRESLEPLWKYYWVGEVGSDPTDSFRIQHTAPVHLVDRSGRIRVVHPSTFRPAELAHDIELLLRR